jgi:DNA polymerase elongation subunit (family B)
VQVKYVSSERELLACLVQLVREEDPDFLIGYEVVMSSWGYLVDRGAVLDVNLVNELSRVPSE